MGVLNHTSKAVDRFTHISDARSDKYLNIGEIRDHAKLAKQIKHDLFDLLLLLTAVE